MAKIFRTVNRSAEQKRRIAHAAERAAKAAAAKTIAEALAKEIRKGKKAESYDNRLRLVQFKLPLWIWERATAYCSASQITLSDLIRTAIFEYLFRKGIILPGEVDEEYDA